MKQIERVYISLALWGLEISDRPDDAELGKWTRELHKNLVLGKKGKDSFTDKLISEVEETRTEWNNRKNKFKETKEKDLVPSAPGGAGNEGESPETPAVKIDPAEIEFETFRKKYPGTKSGHDEAFSKFKKAAGKNYSQIISMLYPALEKEIAWRKKCADINAFCPEWPMLSTWINQKRWNQELQEPIQNKSLSPQRQKTFREIDAEKEHKNDAEIRRMLGE